MASVFLLKRGVSKTHPREVPESDTVIISGLERATSGAAVLYTDANTTTITIGGGAAQTTVTIGRAAQTTNVLGGLQVDEAIFGPTDGSGLVVGSAGGTGSALQVVTLTTTERNALTAAAGMIVYNSTTGALEGYDGSWSDLSGGGGGVSLTATLVIGSITGGEDIDVSTGDSILGVAELTLAALAGAASLDASTSVTIGGTTATSLSIGRDGITTTFAGTSTATILDGAVSCLSIAVPTITSASNLDIDAGAALSINSSGSSINIGNDAAAFDMNIGTGAAARTITIGNSTGATAVNITAGTGDVFIDADLSGGRFDSKAERQEHWGTVLATLKAGVATPATVTANNALVVISTGTGGEFQVDAPSTSGTIDFNVGTGGFLVDASGGPISLDCTGLACNFTQTSNSASDGTLTIGSTNSSSGDGNIAITADNLVAISGGAEGITATCSSSGHIVVGSSTSALRVGSMTTGERGSIGATNGNIIYNSTDGELQGFANSAWVTLGGGAIVDTVMWRVTGKPVTATGVDNAFIAPRAGTITRCTLWRRTAGSSGSTIVDVHKNGTTIYSTQGNRPTVTSGGGADAIDATSDMDVTAVAQDDRLEMDVDSVEGGNPQDITVILEIEYT